MRKSAMGAAATCLILLSLPSLAAGPAKNANSGSGTADHIFESTPNTGGVAREGGGASGDQSKFDAAVAGMRASQESTKRVQTMRKVSLIRIVDVGTGGGDVDKAAVKKAASENRSDIQGLRQAIEDNASLSSKLEEKSFKPKDVVAIKLNDDGSLTVYVDKLVP